MKKKLIKQGRKIIGFIYENQNGIFFAYGKPSAPSYISFKVKNFKEGERKILEYSI